MYSWFDLERLHINGVKVNYFFVCKRKLWFFSRNIAMEHASERVSLGKLLHDISYRRFRRKEINIAGIAKFDVVRGTKVIEIKSSKSFREAHRWQIVFYLYILEHFGVKAEGFLCYPRQRKVEEVRLEEGCRKFIEKTLGEIEKIVNSLVPPKAEKKRFCRACAYHDLCFSE